MSTAQIVTLIVAILGVLHGPVTGQIAAAFRKSPPKQ